MPDQLKRAQVPERIAEMGGLSEGVASSVASETGVPEATTFGVGSFFHLLSNPAKKVRVCQGLSCLLRGSKELLAKALASGLPAEGCSCLAACDRAPAALRDREVIPDVSDQAIARAGGNWRKLRSHANQSDESWRGVIGPTNTPDEKTVFALWKEPNFEAEALNAVRQTGHDALLGELERSGLQGRGGAGFPAFIKWQAVRKHEGKTRYVVLNADEGEPGTFKDREILLRRPDLVVEGLAVAAEVVGARDVYCYLRGEFTGPAKVLQQAIDAFGKAGTLPSTIRFHLHAGHGAYICGEESALLEALEGKRGMPRLRPPYPTDAGLWHSPTLIHNVETIACVPAIAKRGGAWFKALGKTGPGTMLYSLSGHIKKPGVYELPLGVCLDELVEKAGGYTGRLKAFSPGGASSGFLPARDRSLPLDSDNLKRAGSMLGSRGVVVLNDSVNMAWAAREQLAFFEAESCGQCAPCRIGTRFLRETMDRFLKGLNKESNEQDYLKHAAEVAWEMNEGSICGLGQAAPLPLTTALEHFPEDFRA